MEHPDRFDVIVVGGGHAGTEAALAAARMGANTLLLTQSIDTLGQMSCNPAIGGIGKSHLVREIDALGGAMARAADQAGIQFRTLNASKGPAVRATRAQADRVLYRGAVRRAIEAQENLTLFQQSVVDLMLDGRAVVGVETQLGLTFRGRCVVLTTGTFLGGQIHVGMQNYGGGRAGDAPSIALADRLRALPLRVGRLKTGTPPRVDSRSVDFSVMTEQPGDEPRPVMSFLGSTADHPRQVSCFVTETNDTTHELIRAALDRSPLFSGVIEGVGPRYCPSIEDKVVRFAERNRHQLFVEPEGLDSIELYPNGISTSLPFDVQLALVRSIRGFETARLTRPGYAIEYDYFDPRDLKHSLETRVIDGLFFAGQINGTTGYEEAGAQGLLAGTNAALLASGADPWCPGRHEAYLGVLIDDLVTLGVDEPYRMFTSRAEYRLRLRQDNADARLTETGHQLGLVGTHRLKVFHAKQAAVAEARARLATLRVVPSTDLAERFTRATGEAISRDVTMLELLRRPKVGVQQLVPLVEDGETPRFDASVWEQVGIEVKYEGYIRRQDDEIDRVKRHETLQLPALDYHQIDGLSTELRQKLSEAQPTTLARAARIPGMTPAALSLLMIYARKQTLVAPVSAAGA